MPWYPRGFLPCAAPPAPLSQTCVGPRCAGSPSTRHYFCSISCSQSLDLYLVVKGEWRSLSHEMGQDLLTLGMCLSSFSAQKHLCLECKVPLHFNVSHFKRQFPSITGNTARQWGCHPPVMPEWGRKQRGEHCVREQGTAEGPPTWQPHSLTVYLHFLLGTKLWKFTWSQCIFSPHLWQNKNWACSTPSRKTCTVCAADR